jgi:hypothetical protein
MGGNQQVPVTSNLASDSQLAHHGQGGGGIGAGMRASTSLLKARFCPQVIVPHRSLAVFLLSQRFQEITGGRGTTK